MNKKNIAKLNFFFRKKKYLVIIDDRRINRYQILYLILFVLYCLHFIIMVYWVWLNNI